MSRISRRERVFIITGGASLLLMAAYTFVIAPMLIERSRLHNTLPKLRQTVKQVELYASEIDLLKEATGASNEYLASAEDLVSVLEISAAEANIDIKTASAANASADGNYISVHGSTAFPNLFRWLEHIRRKEGIAVTSMKLTPTTQPDNVSFTIAVRLK